MKVVLGLSGGVDSAVTGYLLKKAGYEVVGVFMKNWSDDFGLIGDCPWREDLKDAKEVAEFLGIEFLSYNFELEYRERVIKYFFKEYKEGRTPNPDILCNSEIKFDVFLNKAIKELGVDKVATGHYAKVEYDEKDKISKLYRGRDRNKDQSYFLCGLDQDQLSKMILPLGDLSKPEVRQIASEINLPVANKKDSQGICFLGEIDVNKFLKEELGMKKGEIIDIDTGLVLGEHKGLWFYTEGQREGIGLSGGPFYVVKKDILLNRLYVAKGNNNKHLYSKKVIINNINIINKEVFFHAFSEQTNIFVSLRYRQTPSIAKIIAISDISETSIQEQYNTEISIQDSFEIEFLEPQRAPAKGQYACIHNKDCEEIIASGVIVE